ncbi:MAG TPA: NAD(P)H-quinone oxidoreductase [Spongiibacteraceae bacterium]
MTLPDRMRFVSVDHPGAPEAMQIAQGPLPQLKAGEVLIKVEAAGINRPDIQQRRGFYPPPPDASPILGLEVAGTVVDVNDSSAWRIGDRVCALANGGGYAEYCAVPATQCLPWPRGYDAVQAAALPENYFTVWANLFQIGRLARGESALVHGGSSGIGITALQLGVEFGARVFVTAGSEEKCATCVRLGAEIAINYRTADFAAVIAEHTHKRGVDVILDMVAGDYTPRNLASLAPQGRLLLIGLQRGTIVQQFDLTRIMTRRLLVTGSTLRPRTQAEKAEIATQLHQHIWPILDEGRCAPLIYRVFDFTDVAQAHALMESSAHVGKIVLRI